MVGWTDEPPPVLDEDYDGPGECPRPTWSLMLKTFQAHERRDDHKQCMWNIHPELARIVRATGDDEDDEDDEGASAAGGQLTIGDAAAASAASNLPLYAAEEIIEMHEKGLIVIAYALALRAEPPTGFPAECAKARQLKAPGFELFIARDDESYANETRECCNTLIELISSFIRIAQKMRAANALYIAVEGDGSTDVGKSHK